MFADSRQGAGFAAGDNRKRSGESIAEAYNAEVSAIPHTPPAIILKDLVKFFGRFAAIRGISGSFAPGRLYVVLGDNGAGKSTLLRMVAGLMEPSQGTFTLLGTNNHREVAHRVGYMGHAPLLYDELSGMENLRYFAGLYGLATTWTCLTEPSGISKRYECSNPLPSCVARSIVCCTSAASSG